MLASPVDAGRAIGNIRQPNLLSSLFLLSACAWLYVGRRFYLKAWMMWGGAVIWAAGIAMSGSRTGGIGLFILSAWGLLARKDGRASAWTLPAMGPLYGVCVGLLWQLDRWGWVQYFAEVRLHTQTDISSSRFKIWHDTIELIKMHPWTGVGWDNFNFAWTLTIFPHRPIAFFDHTHNIFLHSAVELGIPVTLGLTVIGLILLWKSRSAWFAVDDVVRIKARTCLAIFVLMMWHSQLEYPLWYAYFLLPFAFTLGHLLGLGAKERAVRRVDALSASEAKALAYPRLQEGISRCMGLIVIVLAVQGLSEYRQITSIFAPTPEQAATSLEDRIETGRESRLFGYQADYAWVTTAQPQDLVESDFARPLHELVDARLMMSYANFLHSIHEDYKAVYVTQRLKEFKNPLSQNFFKPCHEAVVVPTSSESSIKYQNLATYQCNKRPAMLSYKDFPDRP